MRKTILTFILCMAAIIGMADEQKKVTLSNDNPKETVNLSYANIFLTLSNAGSDDDHGQVIVEVENLDESKLLALFHKAYTEKQVKKLSPSFQYDKLFGGSKGKRIIDSYNLETGKDVFVEPSQKHTLAAFNVTPDKNLVLHLPIYIAKAKEGIVEKILGKEKLLLLRKQLIEIDVEVSMKPSAEYLGLQEEVETMKREVKNTVICTDKKHRPNAEGQKANLQKRVDDLKAKIESAISSHGWNAGDAGYTRFNALKEELDALEVGKRTGICSAHRVEPKPTHQCSYCNLSLQQIYHKLDDLYKKIYSSSNRQATKQSVMGQVNAMYNCCTAADCAKHKRAWASGGGGYKSKIQERYNRIQGL